MNVTSERINELLKENGGTQRWLADNAEVSPAAVNKWIRNSKGITIKHAQRCADLLGCSSAYLLGFSDKRTLQDEADALRYELIGRQFEKAYIEIKKAFQLTESTGEEKSA